MPRDASAIRFPLNLCAPVAARCRSRRPFWRRSSHLAPLARWALGLRVVWRAGSRCAARHRRVAAGTPTCGECNLARDALELKKHTHTHLTFAERATLMVCHVATTARSRLTPASPRALFTTASVIILSAALSQAPSHTFLYPYQLGQCLENVRAEVGLWSSCPSGRQCRQKTRRLCTLL